MSTSQKKIEEVMEEYNRKNNIPIDVTESITHEEFVLGVQNKKVGIKVIQGEPITLVRGARKTIFNILVMMYLVVPILVIPLWAYHESNWLLLIGIPVASLIATHLAQIKGQKIGCIFLLALIIFWATKGIHNYFTFFSLCAFWGYMFFQMAESAQNDYALQSLVESPDLFTNAIAQQRIIVIRRREL